MMRGTYQAIAMAEGRERDKKNALTKVEKLEAENKKLREALRDECHCERIVQEGEWITLKCDACNVLEELK